MSYLTLVKTRIQAGTYEGVLSSTGNGLETPEITLQLDGADVGDVLVTPLADAPGQFLIRAKIPTTVLTDGVQSFALAPADGSVALDSFTIISGEPLEDDIRAEIALLRAELDMLKRAFRRHCVETLG